MQTIGVVLAAGLGTRLRPGTDLCPKPLIPVAGIEPLFFALEALQRVGIRRVIVNAHHLPELVERAVLEWRSRLPDLEVRVSVEKSEILGTGGAILKIVREHHDWFKGSGLLLQNGDTFARIPLDELIQDGHRDTFAVSRKESHLRRYKPLWIDANGVWQGIGPTPPSGDDVPAHFLGVHYLSPKAVQAVRSLGGDRIPSIDLFNGIYRPLSDTGFRFEAREFLRGSDRDADFWFDMNTPEFLLEAQRELLDRLGRGKAWRQMLEARYPGIRQESPGVWFDASIPHGTAMNVESPALVVGLSGPGIGSLKIGPHASLICAPGAMLSVPSASSIRGSVVLVTKNAKLQGEVSNELRVL